MAETTRIAWTDSTLNPWIGCTKVGPGCDHCYASALDSRQRWGGTTHWGAGVPRHRTSISTWNNARKWNKEAARTGKRHLVFCASLADVFDNEVPQEWRTDLFALIRETPALTWQLVTKRIGNVPRMLPPDWGAGYPNVWIISTIVNQEEADRDLPKLLSVPAFVHGVSYEPALGPVQWGPLLELGPHAWIIIGGESTQGGAKGRPFDLHWARSTIRQCQAANVPVFVKQVGSTPFLSSATCYGVTLPLPDPTKIQLMPIKDRAGAKPEEWPADIHVRQFPGR